MNFGEKLKGLRTQKGWSQEELAKQMGVTRRTIGGYEVPPIPALAICMQSWPSCLKRTSII
jgi:DNA-binding XRE family transcriptional regulator